ncbi:hypothetical protein [Streptomyces sp. NBC_00212]|uniref:hypothetical protein n=1 Tax=Streptomyces sp. NBC_00212 TaxID=2975684 RepID=UPI00324A10D6
MLYGLPAVAIATRLAAPVDYDALGRPLMVWQPDRSQRDGSRASREFRSGTRRTPSSW